ncbi:MAG: hypothetical protein LW715_00950 [Rhodobacter sp.]|jgi:putative flippase GtrA|nr:hypothetical protein [Rhodobacter sp.]
MSNLDRKITRFMLELAVVLAVAGALTLAVLWALAVLIPLPPEGLARELRNAVGLAVAGVIGLRLSRWLERRWGDD